MTRNALIRLFFMMDITTLSGLARGKAEIDHRLAARSAFGRKRLGDAKHFEGRARRIGALLA